MAADAARLPAGPWADPHSCRPWSIRFALRPRRGPRPARQPWWRRRRAPPTWSRRIPCLPRPRWQKYPPASPSADSQANPYASRPAALPACSSHPPRPASHAGPGQASVPPRVRPAAHGARAPAPAPSRKPIRKAPAGQFSGFVRAPILQPSTKYTVNSDGVQIQEDKRG